MTVTVFISHTDEDIERCGALLRTLDAWNIPYYFDAVDRRASHGLSAETQQALVESDIMLRVCTRDTNRSYWMSIEVGALLSLQADDHRAGALGRHRLVNLTLDSGYRPEPFDVTATVVDATRPNDAAWVNELRRALDLEPLADPAEAARIASAVNPVAAKGLSRRAVVGLGAAATLALAAGATGATWLLRRSAGAATHAAGPPSTDARLRWWYRAASPGASNTAAIVAEPLLDGDTLYVTTLQASILALSLSGKPLWQFALPAGSGVAQTPAVANGVVYAVGLHAGVYAVQNGKSLWFRNAFAPATTEIVLAANRLYTNALNGTDFISEYDPQTGALVGSLNVTPFTVPSSGVALAGNLLYCGGQNGYLYALDASQPQSPLRWRADVGATRQAKENVSDTYNVNAIPVLANEIVYAGSTDSNLYALDAQTGARRWVFATGAPIALTSPAVADGVVYVSSQDKSLYALDAQTGARRWRFQTQSATISAPVVAQGVVYIGSGDHAVYALDAQSGALHATYRTAASVFAQPTVMSGVLFAADALGYVYAFTLV